MAKIQWDKAGEKEFELGTDRGVLFVATDEDSYGVGVPWNGLVGVSESPEGGEPSEIYADNIIYGVLVSPEKLKLTIEHFSSPPEFYACDGCAMEGGVLITGQPRTPFAFSFRSKLGNDITPESGYKLHLVWGCRAGVAERGYKTIGDSPEVITFSRPVSTLPVSMADGKVTAELIIDSRFTDPQGLADLEAMLYGTDSVEPEMPTPDDVVSITRIAYVSPSTASKAKGDTQQYTCVDFLDQAIPCEWSIDSELSTISSIGLLTVGAEEVAETITVTATPLDSRIDPKTAVLTVGAGT